MTGQDQKPREEIHGTAAEAVEFALSDPHGVVGDVESFLRYWDAGDLRAWPSYYQWLATHEGGAVVSQKIARELKIEVRVMRIAGVALVLASLVKWAFTWGLNNPPSFVLGLAFVSGALMLGVSSLIGPNK